MSQPARRNAALICVVAAVHGQDQLLLRTVTLTFVDTLHSLAYYHLMRLCRAAPDVQQTLDVDFVRLVYASLSIPNYLPNADSVTSGLCVRAE